MISTVMILAGMMMMIWPNRTRVELDPSVGMMLNEAYPARAPIPADMRPLMRRVAVELQLVGANHEHRPADRRRYRARGRV